MSDDTQIPPDVGDPGGPGDPGGDASRDARVAALLRGAGAVEVEPGEHVWERIRAEVAGDGAPADEVARRRRDRAAGPARRGSSHRSRRPARWPLLAAAAVGALVAWLGTELVGPNADDEGVVVADASLSELPDAGLTVEGNAEVVTIDGERRLRLDLSDLPDAGEGYLEVWLMRPDVSGMVTVGILSGDTAEFTLPAGVDLADYPVVDISREQVDGDPSHGGDSLVRGELEQLSAGRDPSDGIQ